MLYETVVEVEERVRIVKTKEAGEEDPHKYCKCTFYYPNYIYLYPQSHRERIYRRKHKGVDRGTTTARRRRSTQGFKGYSSYLPPPPNNKTILRI